MQRRVFAPVLAAMLLVLVGGTIALQLGIAGARFLPALNEPHPALASAPPHIGPARPRLARRVFLVIIDGLRVRESIGLPFLDQLRRAGIETTATSDYPTFSRPNYVTVVTGVPPLWSGVRSNNYNTTVELESLMDRVHASGLRVGFVSNYSPGLPRMFTHLLDSAKSGTNSPTYRSDFDDMHYVDWPGGFVSASRLLIERGYPLVLMHLGEVDAAGHEFGGNSGEYRRAVRLVDDKLARALDGIDLTRDAVIVVADHGHTDAGGHGGLEPEVVEVPLVLAGAGVRPGAAVVGADLVDIAPTAATLLGSTPPGHGLGRTLTEALMLDDAAKKAIEHDDTRRIEENTLLTLASLDDASASQAVTRLWRLLLLAGLTLLAGLGIYLGRRLGALRLDWRVLIIALPAFPVTYYLAIGLLEQQYSPSAIPSLGDMTGKLVRWGLVSTGAQIIASWFALRGRVVLRERLAAANGLTACGLLLGFIPASLSWALFPGPFVDVPGPSLMVLIPATLVAVAFFAMASAATLVLEIVVFFARAVDPRIRLQRLERAASRERDRIETESQADAARDSESVHSDS